MQCNGEGGGRERIGMQRINVTEKREKWKNKYREEVDRNVIKKVKKKLCN